MRKTQAIMALCVGVGLAAPVAAQQVSGASTFTAVEPRNITFTPIDTSKFASQFNASNAFPIIAPQKAFSLTNLFHPFTMPSWPPKLGSSNIPANLLPQQPANFTPLTSADLPTMQVPRSTTLLPF